MYLNYKKIIKTFISWNVNQNEQQVYACKDKNDYAVTV